MTIFGVHTGLQNISSDDLRASWRRIESLGYGWISIWDHFYGATGKPDDAECLESVAMHAALACETSRVRIGSLVYSIGYRHPAILAKAITTIDHLSNGRAEMGIGAGWAQVEYNAYGIEFPEVKVRMDQLEEGIQVLRGMLHTEASNFEGKYFTTRDARNEPRPVQAKMPIWVGGGGEKRTLKITAKYADGWNVPFVSPEEFARKRGVLHEHCAAVGRNPDDISCAINVGLAWTEESLNAQFGHLANAVRNGCLTGSDEQVLDRIGQYIEAGANQVNIALRAPFDLDALERLSVALKLA
jgi:F420-dependent oxidoreductase-like protein